MTLPTTKLSAFLPYIMPFAPGCPRPVAEAMLRLAAIEFCSRTWIWKRTVTFTPVTNNATFPLPVYTALARIERIWCSDVLLDPILIADLQPTKDGVPQYYAQNVPNELILWPFSAVPIRVEMALRPAMGELYGTDAADPLHNAFNVVPPFLFDDHLEAMKCGALSRLAMIPDEPFTDPQSALMYQEMFERQIVAAASNQSRLKANAPRRTTARWM